MATKRKGKPARGAKAARPTARSRAGARGAAAKATRATRSTKATKARSSVKAKPIARKSAARRGGSAGRTGKALRLRSLAPNFTVNDVAESLRFYVEGLGFTVKQRWEKDGRLMGVMLAAGDIEVWLGQDDWAKGRDRVKGVGFRIYAQTAQNLGALAERVRAHGFEADGPKTESWGDTTVTVVDADGFKITFHGKKMS